MAQVVLVTATIGVTLALPLAPAAAAECENRIQEALNRADVRPEQVTSMQVVHSRGGGLSANNYRINAWVRLNSCRGYAVVTLTHYCTILQSYTTGDCRTEGAPHYEAWWSAN
ncbi:hypothetical protein [Pelagibius sp. 7325]|uniref:hypothetical protein n=1 Tax=Pelagibius sp. 7325 TaxID=3131994 RepID=UPI0030ED1F63